jgi:hypothetical protein
MGCVTKMTKNSPNPKRIPKHIAIFSAKHKQNKIQNKNQNKNTKQNEIKQNEMKNWAFSYTTVVCLCVDRKKASGVKDTKVEEETVKYYLTRKGYFYLYR